MTFGLIYLGVFVILIWAFLLSSNLGAGYRYKFWPVSAPEDSQIFTVSATGRHSDLTVTIVLMLIKGAGGY